MASLLRKLNRVLFHKYLWATNTITSGVLLALGDGIQQTIEIHHEKETSFNLIRSGILTNILALKLCNFSIFISDFSLHVPPYILRQSE